MLPLLTFIGHGIVGWFAPTALYPNAKATICATNAAPVGSTIHLYDDKTRRGADCRVVGKIVSQSGHLVNVSESVHNELGFRVTGNVYAYRVLGALKTCNGAAPPPQMCNLPPAACLRGVPQSALVVCI